MFFYFLHICRDIDMSMLDVSLLKGTFELRNIKLNHTFLNTKLSELYPSPTPFIIESGISNNILIF